MFSLIFYNFKILFFKKILFLIKFCKVDILVFSISNPLGS